MRNRTQLVQGPSGSQTTSTYTYDRADRILTSGTNGHITDTMDADGNLKSRTGGSVNDSFSYDQANRLTSATTSAGSGTYRYDGDGKRTSKTVGGTTTNYVYDIAGGLPRLLSDGAHKFVWGANGLAYNIAISGGAVATYHADQIGSIREITNADGSVRTTYLTDEYGNRTTAKGTDDQPFQYTGEQVDPETGFVYLRSRYYDAATGRFLTRDPVSGTLSDPGTLNRFAYTTNNPINLADPSGSCIEDACIIEGGAAAALICSAECPALVERASELAEEATPFVVELSAEVQAVANEAAQVPYNSTDLGQIATAVREVFSVFTPRNVAVFEYQDDTGELQTLYAISQRGVGHAERLAADALTEMGIDPARVTRIYSELEPCGSIPGGYCSSLIQRLFSSAQVTYSFPYGDTAESRQGGIAGLLGALETVFGTHP